MSFNNVFKKLMEEVDDFEQPRTAYFTYGTELTMSLGDARCASHQGQCIQDVQDLVKDAEIASQLDAIGPDMIRKELKEYGAWDEEELMDDESNRERFVWLAAGDIVEDEKEGGLTEEKSDPIQKSRKKLNVCRSKTSDTKVKTGSMFENVVKAISENDEDKYRITVTYEVVSPESAEQGDTEETGVEGEYDNSNLYDLIEDYLLRVGGLVPSASYFHPGVWYSESDGDLDYKTGHVTTKSYHLSRNLPDHEQKIVWDSVKSGKNLAPNPYNEPDDEDEMERTRLRDMYLKRHEPDLFDKSI